MSAPTSRVDWQRGPTLTSSPSELVAWFEAQTDDGIPRMTRVPIVLQKGAIGWSTTGAQIGALVVHLNDAALGIGIAMRARRCTEARCAFLVEGRWRGAMDGAFEFEIVHASATAMTAAAYAAITYVEVAHAR